MIKGVIFDMDGVLVDNKDVHIESFVAFCRNYGCEISVDTIVSVFGRGNDEILPCILPAGLIEEKGIDTLSMEKETIYRRIYKGKVEPLKGLVDFLKDLKNNGIKIAVGSSGPSENVNFILEECQIAGYFDVIVNGDMVENRKPAPDIFLKAAEMLGVSPAECLVAEDSFAGIEAANTAGMKVAAIATTHTNDVLAKASYNIIADDFSQLSFQIINKL